MGSQPGAPLSFYIHIPYCVKRCGYCDFNTYTPAELQVSTGLTDISRSYIDLVIAEAKQARAIATDAGEIPTIFFGGGTPTLMEPEDLQRILRELESSFGFAHDIEITIEANPDTVTRDKLSALRAIGINRISFGMQSASAHVLALLDRTHNPENVGKATQWAREVGFEHISVDLIYGTPTETLDDWRQSVNAALALPIDHLSAYALIVEDGTKFAAQVKRGEIASPDDDAMADKYIIVDDLCTTAGMSWYELSNWSKPNGECRHNVAYWRGADWWGLGPGAHSHINGERWWNVKHPSAYRDRIHENTSPALDSERLTESEKESERIMLLIRMPNGISKVSLSQSAQLRLAEYLPTGHIDSDAWARGAVCLTQSGRLIADRIVQEILL